MSDDPALNAAVRLVGPERGRAMLGCDWGTKLGVLEDFQVCPRQARARFVLHSADGERDIKVCAEHAAVVERMTDPHEGCSSDG